MSSKAKCNGILLQNKTNEILLVLDKKRNWSFPKGGQETYDDSTYEGARREFKEEAGLTGFTYSYIPDSYLELSDKGNPSCNLYFARISHEHDDYGFIDGHSDPDNDIIEARWFSIESIIALDDNCFRQKRKNVCEIALSINDSEYTKQDCFLSAKKHKIISKTMSWCCRHGLDTFKSKDEELSITTDELLNKLNKDYNFPIDFTMVRRIIYDCPKQRYQLNDKRMRIRAAQGHSGGIAKGAESFLFEEIKTPVLNVMHSTDRKALISIKTHGLYKMARDQIHMCDDAKMLKQGKPILLRVDMESAMQPYTLADGTEKPGIKFYRASNGDILSPGDDHGFIPARFIIFPDVNEKQRIKEERNIKRRETYNKWVTSGISV